MKVTKQICYCEIMEITSCDGEAIVNNRKAKLIFFYEWVLKMKWKGYLKGNSEEVEGNIEIPNLSEEHKAEDIDINVSIKTSSPEAEILKELMRIKGTEIIHKQLDIYISSLKKEFSQGMILPTTKDKEESPPNTKKPSKIPITQQKNNQSVQTMQSKIGVQIEITKVTMTESFKCTAEEFYKAMTIKEMVQAFTQGPAVLEVEKGGKFEMFGGNITGTFTELIPNKKIRQHWRFKTWPEAHFSEVTIVITQKEDSTEVSLTQMGVPKNDYERTKEGWKNYYWQNMKRVFGFGAMLI